jgi:hypothetical protein
VARVSKVDACLMCGATPCECGKRKQTRSAPNKIESAPLEKPVKREIPRLRPRYTRTTTKPAHIQVADADLVFIAALRNVESILHPEERDRYKSQLMTPETHDERTAFWKARRDHG